MSGVLIASIALRILGTGYSVLLLRRSGDRRFAFLTVMLGLMTSRQVWTLQTTGGAGLAELPGLVVSGLAVAVVYYLSQYVDEEDRIKSELEAMNDRLRSFRKAVEQAGHAIFLTDPDGRIEYANSATESVTGYAPSELVGRTPAVWQSGKHDDAFYDDLWSTITDGDVWDGEVVNRRRNGELCWVDATIAPITADDGSVERFVAVEADVTERKERELRIRDQHDRLELLNTTNAIIRDVTQELLRTESKAEVEAVSCEQFASAGPYESAWFATRNAVTDTVRPNTSVGIDDDALEDVVAAVNDDDRETVVDRALETETTHVAQVCQEGRPDCTRTCECRLAADAVATVAIPITYRDAHYGALVLHTGDDNATDALDVEVLDELGETIAYAITAAESQRSLVTDRVTALTFDLTPADDPLPALASALEADVELELEQVTTGTDGDLVEFVTVRGADTSDIAARAADISGIESAQRLRADSEPLLRLTVDETAVVSTLAQYGGCVQSLTADGDQCGTDPETGSAATLVAELPETADVRTVVEAVTESHPGADLVGQHERDRTPETSGQFRSAVEDSTTDRQLEALRLAHFGGFFEWPRDSSGDDLADRMGVCQSTYLQHLRAAQRKVFEQFFDAERPTDSGYPVALQGKAD
ncbi:PAS domain S-box-containing protein [Halobiforma haloterrestris]|uniref:PAS domain S-box-containing protein n=1 Tax=Natronobacterium haloterrestre TaxID=148448 RepID=A0A1I1L935_NATHA|nr:bacterio-opsin activator domain-containing protein [Halobiforma haloterrestris]SFC69516.1 PAS domain S-box-containing protein [Halobiforma haloterrestris]